MRSLRDDADGWRSFNQNILKQIFTWSLLLAFRFPCFSLSLFLENPSCCHSLTETHPLVSRSILHIYHHLLVYRSVLPAMSVGREELNKTSFMGFLDTEWWCATEKCEIFADLISFYSPISTASQSQRVEVAFFCKPKQWKRTRR